MKDCEVEPVKKNCLKTLAGLVFIFLIMVGLAAAVVIKDKETQRLKIQNGNLAQKLESQEQIVNNSKAQIRNLSHALTNVTKAQKMKEARIEDLTLKTENLEAALNESKTSLKPFQEFISSTNLHEAAKNGNWKLAKLLILENADVNQIDDNGDYPLQLAVLNGHPKVVAVLLQNGARKDLKKLLASAQRSKMFSFRRDDYNTVIHLLKNY